MRKQSARQSGRRFPVMHLVILIGLIWGSMWGAGTLGSRVGEHIYTTRVAPPTPYSAEQIRSMERASPDTAEMAKQDLHVWTETVTMGESIARVEGALAGTLLMLAIWGSIGAVWLFGRERERFVRGGDRYAEV